MKTIVTVSGIRPDFIRMSEVFKTLDAALWCKHILVHTGQHYDELLSGIFFKDLNIRRPDYNLAIGAANKSHYQQQSDLGPAIIDLFQKENISPDVVLFLGDSNSVLASVPLRKEGYKIGHIEAGMRSYDERMLEEINRKVCDHVSNFLFVYHKNYKQKALREGIAEDRIYVVGNTIVEPLQKIADKKYIGSQKHILLDIHRPENFNHKVRLEAILKYANECIEIYDTPIKMLAFGRTALAIERYELSLGNIQTVPMMGYREFVKAQQDSRFIISDSGTAQEEPALLGIPVIVPRDFTERPESVENNCSYMLSLEDKACWCYSYEWLSTLSKSSSNLWLGRGDTSKRIVDILEKEL